MENFCRGFPFHEQKMSLTSTWKERTACHFWGWNAVRMIFARRSLRFDFKKVIWKLQEEQLTPLSLMFRTAPQLQFLGFGIRRTLLCRFAFRFSRNRITSLTWAVGRLTGAIHSCELMWSLQYLRWHLAQTGRYSCSSTLQPSCEQSYTANLLAFLPIWYIVAQIGHNVKPIVFS